MGKYETMVAFLDLDCPQSACECELTLDEADKSISECEAMLQYSLEGLQLNPDSEQWKDEVASWRRMLQEAKKAKRRMLASA